MRNIYLVGFMGTGKTSVARLLSQRLKCKLADMDAMIEKKEGMAIRDIFKVKGEPYFRGLEKDLVSQLSAGEGYVVACGGGVFADADNRKRMKDSGVVICLASSPETILKRTGKNQDRPLLNVADPAAQIRDLLKKREACYSQAHHTLDCDRLSVEESTEAVLKILKNDE